MAEGPDPHQPRRLLRPAGLADRPRAAARALPAACARHGAVAGGPAYLEEAQDDATRLAIADQERAGLDIVTDGEMRRESYSNRFATALDGVDIDNPGTALDRSGHPNPVPRVVGPGVAPASGAGPRPRVPARRTPAGTTKITVPGPVHDVPAGAGRLLRDPGRGRHGLRRRGARRDPRPVRGGRRRGPGRRALHAGSARGRARLRPRRRCAAPRTASPAPPRSTSASGTRRSSTSARAATRSCPSWPPPSATRSASRRRSRASRSTCSTRSPRRRSSSACSTSPPTRWRRPRPWPARIRRAFPHAGPERLIAAPDCGMKYLPRDSAYGKLESLVEGARIAAATP